MNATAKQAQNATSIGEISAETVVAEVVALYTELHRGEAAPQTVNMNSHLERDLGFDSLGRVELGLRLEARFGVHLSDAGIGSADTIADLLGVLSSAAAISGITAHPKGTAGRPVVAPRAALGTPSTATTLNEVLAWHAEQHPNATHAILLDEDASRAMTYAQLRDGAQEIAGALQRAGLQPEIGRGSC